MGFLALALASGSAIQGIPIRASAEELEQSRPEAEPVSSTSTAEIDLSLEDLNIIPPPPPVPAQTQASTPTAASAGAAPLPPTQLVAEAGNRSVQLGWYPSEGASPISGYLVFRGEHPEALDPQPIHKRPIHGHGYLDNEENSFAAPLNRRTYYYAVRAYDEEGRLSAYSQVVSATPSGPLLPPGKLRAVQDDGRITLHWSEPPSTGDYELSAFQLFRSEHSGRYGEPYMWLPPVARTFTDSELPNGKPFYYMLRSVDTQGAVSEPSPEVRATAYVAVKPPRNLRAQGVGDEAVVLRWDPSEGGGTFPVEAYNVYRSTFSPVDLSGRPINKVPVSGKTQYEDSPEFSLEAPRRGVEYYYAVVAVDREGNPSAPSAEAKAAPVATLERLGGGEVEIPGAKDTTLSIAGKKTIDLGYTQVFKSNRDNPNTFAAGVQEGFLIDQQLQVRLTGKVGRKIKVDVDYDDKAQSSEQQQRISVVYTGDPQEVFKEFAFGDILMDLSSPRTEFAGYNKNLFGAKVKLESPDQRFRLTAIGAQTKGFTETKRIVGGLEQVKTGNALGRDILDSAFIPYRYYYLSREKELVEGPVYIDPGSVEVYVDQPGITFNHPNKIVVDDAAGRDKFNFVRLVPGDQYSVDVATGLLIFNNFSIRPQDNILVAFVKVDPSGARIPVGYRPDGSVDFTPAHLDSDFATGRTTDSKHLIQYGSRYTSTYDSHMSFQFYNLGNRDILNPQLDPDFKLIIYGTDQRAIYELDRRSDFSDVVEFDTRLGLMKFRTFFPFKKTLSSPADLKMDIGSFTRVEEPINSGLEDIYRFTQPQHNFTIHLEYKYRVSSYSLRFNIIRGSEFITLDGRKLARDVDYFLDYDTGILVFTNPDLIRPESVIEATYEYLPFGGQFTSTIWGARGEYDIVPGRLLIGSTFIMNSSDAPLETPDVRSTPYSLALLDGDILATFSKEKISDLLAGLTGGRTIPFSMTVRAEAAHSWYNPNTFNQHNETGVGMIDNFESVDNIISASMDENAWFPSSRPILDATDVGLPNADRNFSKLVNAIVPGHDARQRAQNNENPNRTVLHWTYQNFTTPQKWDAFVYSLNVANRSLSDFSSLEIWVKVDSGITLNVDVGQVSEDATDNGLLDTESSTGIVGRDDDIGFWNERSLCPGGGCYPLPSQAPERYADVNYWGKDNRTLDTEDLDGTGTLDRTNSFYRFSRRLEPISNDTNGFVLVKVPLTSAQVIDPANQQRSLVPGSVGYYNNIRHVRIWISGADQANGQLWIESIQFKGSKWQIRPDPNATLFGVPVTADTSKFQVNAISALTDESVAVHANNPLAHFVYSPNTNFVRVQTEADKTREQGLQVEYRLTAQDQTNGKPHYMARRILSTGTTLDMGNYETLRLDLYKPHDNLPGETLLLRLGVDDFNYFEYHIPLDRISSGSWQTVSLALDGSDGARTQVGQPYLRNVKFVALAILTYNPNLKSDDPRLDSGRELLWINNLRLADAILREGTAYKINVSYDLGSLGSLSQDFREIESDFIRVDTQNDAPKRHERVHSLSAQSSKISWLPLNCRWENRQLFSEPEYREDPLYSRNFIDPDENIQRLSASVGFTLIPRLNVQSTASLETSRRIFLPAYVEAQRLIALPEDKDLLPHQDNRNFRFSQTASLVVPSFMPLLKDDQLNFEWSFDESVTRFDQETENVLTFKNSQRRLRTFRGRYTGQYRLLEGLSFSPSYAYTYSDAQGNIPIPSVRNPYYDLGPDRSTFDPATGTDDYQPQSRVIEPSLTLQYDRSKFVRNPRLSYRFTQTRDYISNELRSSGSLQFTSTLLVQDLLGGEVKVPEVTFTQEWSVDATVNSLERIRNPQAAARLRDWFERQSPEYRARYQNDVNRVPNLALLEQQRWEQSTWWVRVEDLGMGENLKDPLHIENIASSASRRSSSQFSTRFDLPLLPGWTGSFTPRLGFSAQRTMSQPEQTTRQEQLSLGSGADFRDPKLPLGHWYKPTNLNLNLDFSSSDTFDTQDKRTVNRITTSFRATLPGKPTEKLALSLNYAVSHSKDTNFIYGSSGAELRPIEVTRTSYEPSLTANYFLDVSKTVKLWEVWPFNGRLLRIKQSFKLDNSFSVRYQDDSQGFQTNVPPVQTELYTLTNSVNYNMMENVTGRLLLEQKVFNDRSPKALDNNFYSIKLVIGLAAVF